MLGSYSYSSLDSFRTCPRKFKFRYIEKKEIPKRVSADLYLGNVVHRMMELLYRHGADGVVYAKDDIMQEYQKEWDKIDLDTLVLSSDHYTVDDFIRIGREMLDRWYDKKKPFKEGQLIGVEQMISFNLPETPFRFQAKIDRLWKRDDGLYEIADYKTGRHISRVNDHIFYFQMGIYELAVRQNYPHIKNIVQTHYYLRMDEVISQQMTPDQIDMLTAELKQAVFETINAERLNNFPTKEGGHCIFCEYYDFCPAIRHKKALEDDSISFEDMTAEEIRELTDKYLEKYLQSKELQMELDQMKMDIVEIARVKDLTKFQGDLGKVTVKIENKEKLVTKSDDPITFSDLQMMAKELGLDDYFKLDGQGLMRDLRKPDRFSEDAIERLNKFISLVESTSVRATPKKGK